MDSWLGVMTAVPPNPRLLTLTPSMVKLFEAARWPFADTWTVFSIWKIAEFDPPLPESLGKFEELPLPWRAPSPKMPGVKRSNEYGSRPTWGSRSISREEMEVPRLAFSVERASEVAVTVTDSELAPIWRVTSKPRGCSAWTTMLLETDFLKPAASTVTV